MVQGTRTVDATSDLLRTQILSGAYPSGKRLPAERALAQELGISRLTLRAALARLQSEGLVQPKQGSGVIVQDLMQTGGVHLLPALIQHQPKAMLAPILQLRRAFAVEVVRSLTGQLTSGQTTELAKLADQALMCSSDELLAINLAFTRKLVLLTDNLPLLLLFNTVTQALAAHPDVSDHWQQQETLTRQSFHAILSLLATADADAAAKMVRSLLEAMDKSAVSAMANDGESR